MGAPSSTSRVLTCSTEVTPVVCQVLMTLGALVVLPSQMNLRVSNSMPGPLTAWAAIMFCMIICTTVPSRGAILASQLPA